MVIHRPIQRHGHRQHPHRCEPPRGSVRVLWADDDPMIRSVMATNLEAEGFDVQTVSDGDEAYEAAVHATAPTSSCSTS